MADLIFVFSTRHSTPAQMAVNLIVENLAQYVVLTGGVNRFTGINEAQAHFEILRANRVPLDRIILEDRSSNTLENVLFALQKIAHVFSPDQITSMIVLTKWYHSRRAVMTLSRHFPPSIRYYALTYEPPGIARVNWWQSENGRQCVLKESERIPKYLAKGDIREIQ